VHGARALARGCLANARMPFSTSANHARPGGYQARPAVSVFEHGLTQHVRLQAAIALLVARRSHNPKVVSSILIGRIVLCTWRGGATWLGACANGSAEFARRQRPPFAIRAAAVEELPADAC
jgi:hypothetical protein